MTNIIATPFGYVIELCYKLIPNYAAALLLFAVIMKVVLFPLSIKQQKNTVKQAKLRPKEMAIRNRYAGRTDKTTQQKMNQEVMQLYQDENYNPASGCLPLILQLVIVLAVYSVVMNPLRYVCHVTEDNMNAINNKISEMYKSDDTENALKVEGLSDSVVNKISTAKEKGKAPTLTGIETVNVIKANGVEKFRDYLPDKFAADDLPDFTLFGGKFDLSGTPSIGDFGWLWLVPLLTFVFTFGSMKLTKKFTYQPPQQGDAAMSMKFMDFTMPLISTFFTFSVPAIVAVYWIYQNVLSVVQQIVLKAVFPYPEFTEAEYKDAEREMNKGIKANKKSKNKSGKLAAHRIDLDVDLPETDGSEHTLSDSVPAEKTDSRENAEAAGGSNGVVPPAKLKDESDKPKK